MNDIVERVARAIYASLTEKQVGAHIGAFGRGEIANGYTCLDGDFDLMAAARAAIAELKDPTDAMWKASYDLCTDYDGIPFDDGYAAMIDAALTSSEK